MPARGGRLPQASGAALFDRSMEREARRCRWQLAGGTGMGLINDYLGYLADRGYSPQTVRAYAFGLQAFARWLAAGRLALGEVSAGVVLRYLAHGRRALLPGLSGYGAMRDPAAPSPHPASRRGTPGGCRAAQRAAGPPGPAETALWPAGPRAAAAAPRPGPRRDHRAAGELPHRLEKMRPATDLPADENAGSPVFKHPVSVPSCPDYPNDIPGEPQNSHCRPRKAHIGVSLSSA